ncbi:sodium:proton antiporter [Bradyrhizobium sp.]|uniref:cation:proton antiporter n=1 Tax=Bradyrhizobium sp. TaxID=376 RepID=UPI000B1B45C9|nr:sodium:proton antiporter [Bradyrhizobium sp.]
MDPYVAVLTGLGIIILLTAWLPMLLKEMPLSLPIICIGLGAAIFAFPGLPGGLPRPQEHLKLTERFTELVVIVSLMGAGLKLDRPLSWANSGVTWRLLGIAMPLTILSIALVAYNLLGLGVAAAIFLAATLAPTDPVLASDVQVGPPQQRGKEDEVRYALTSEAGLNDGLAFPFVNLAIAIALASQTGGSWFTEWVLVDVFWKLAAGAAVGLLVGRGLGWLTFRLPNRAKISRTGDGFVALGITAVAYGLSEMAHGYGFVAVFVAALAFRSVERGHEYHSKLHEFTEQLERLLMMVVLILLGGAISAGGLLSEVNWAVGLFAVVTLFLIRPLASWISLLGRREPSHEKAVIGFFGIRGIGSVYYLSYGLGKADFEKGDLLWSAMTLIILVSIILHGTTVTATMRKLDHIRRSTSRKNG